MMKIGMIVAVIGIGFPSMGIACEKHLMMSQMRTGINSPAGTAHAVQVCRLRCVRVSPAIGPIIACAPHAGSL